MKIRFISYGYKFFEEQGLEPPKHDHLFNLRDLPNPFWDEKLRPYNGMDKPVIEFFEKNELAQKRLNSIQNLVADFVSDFYNNPARANEEQVTFAFRCTGGKHRSIYYSESVYAFVKKNFAELLDTTQERFLELEVEHIEMHRYSPIESK